MMLFYFRNKENEIVFGPPPKRDTGIGTFVIWLHAHVLFITATAHTHLMGSLTYHTHNCDSESDELARII